MTSFIFLWLPWKVISECVTRCFPHRKAFPSSTLDGGEKSIPSLFGADSWRLINGELLTRIEHFSRLGPRFPGAPLTLPHTQKSSQVRIFKDSCSIFVSNSPMFFSRRCKFTLCSTSQFSHATKLRLTFLFFRLFSTPS